MNAQPHARARIRSYEDFLYLEVKLLVILDVISPDVEAHISGRVANDWKEGRHLLMVSVKDAKSFDLFKDGYKIGLSDNWKNAIRW